MDFDALIRMAAALGAVLGLVLLAAWAMRRYGLAGIANPKAGEPRRLSVVEARTLDARRQLVLIRRDGSVENYDVDQIQTNDNQT